MFKCSMVQVIVASLQWLLLHSCVQEKIHWEYHLDQKRMRTHLKLCYEKGKMKLFPICGKLHRHTNAVKCTKEVEIHCTCRLPWTKELTLYGHMAQCGCCRKWFRQQCAAIPQKAFTHKVYDWICLTCAH